MVAITQYLSIFVASNQLHPKCITILLANFDSQFNQPHIQVSIKQAGDSDMLNKLRINELISFRLSWWQHLLI
jgi:hypothetical protein